LQRYGGLAAVYDYLVRGVDFEGWIDYLEELLKKFNYTPKTVLDLACGTGNTLLPLARRGYQASGVDLSPEMVARAEENATSSGLAADFFVADMRVFKSPEPVDLVTCFHDGLNYLLEYRDLVQTFQCVKQSLAQGGLFVFDLNAVRWLSGTQSGETVVEEEELTLIYSSAYHDGEDVWEVNLTCLIREGEFYRKFTEVHREKAYRVTEVQAALHEAGLTPLAVYGAFTSDPPSGESRRHFYVARNS